MTRPKASGTCTNASTLRAQATIPLLPATPPTTPQAWQAVRIVLQNALSQIIGAAGVTGVNVIPQQYAFLASGTLLTRARGQVCITKCEEVRSGHAGAKCGIECRTGLRLAGAEGHNCAFPRRVAGSWTQPGLPCSGVSNFWSNPESHALKGCNETMG